MKEKQVETVGNDVENADGTQVPLAAQTEVKENKIAAIGRSRALDNVRGFIIIMLGAKQRVRQAYACCQSFGMARTRKHKPLQQYAAIRNLSCGLRRAYFHAVHGVCRGDKLQ